MNQWVAMTFSIFSSMFLMHVAQNIYNEYKSGKTLHPGYKMLGWISLLISLVLLYLACSYASEFYRGSSVLTIISGKYAS